MRLNKPRLYSPVKQAILLIAVAMLFSGACTLLPQPTPPPTTPPPPNLPPVIESVTAEKETEALSQFRVTCKASDVDGDILSYHWSADGGVIKDGGSSITWVAPEVPGSYTIKVVVTDGRGGEAIESTTISVASKPNQPPLIKGLTIDGTPPGEENRVREWRTVTIQCHAEDPDGDKLNYLWTKTGGGFSGDKEGSQFVGNPIGWTAPGVTGEYTVTVIVTDGRGGQAEQSVTFKVLCCGR